MEPFSGQDRAQHYPKTQLRGHRGAGRRFMKKLHGASAGGTFLPSPGARKRPKTGIRRALGRFETYPEGALKGTLSRFGCLWGGVKGVMRDFGGFGPPREFRATPFGPRFGTIFGPRSGPKQPQNRTWRAPGRRKAIFAKFARRLSGKHIFAFAEWSKETQNGHPAGSRAMTTQPQNGA